MTSEIVIIAGLLLLWATVAHQVDTSPWLAVALIGIGAAIKCFALWRGTYEDDVQSTRED